MDRAEYLSRAGEFCLRGQDLPHTKLLGLDVVAIREMARRREDLRDYIREELSNAALARNFGVHVRTIEKVLSYETARHVL